MTQAPSSRILFPLFSGALLLATGAFAGAPEYTRALPDGTSALRKVVGPAELPDLGAGFDGRDAALFEAIERSVAWFDNPSARSYFPVKKLDVSYERARTSTVALRELLRSSATGAEFRERVLRDFDVYESVGWDGNGTVLFTGYYTPIFRASRNRTEEYCYPLYSRPPDLLVDPVTDQVLGRQAGGKVQPYPKRVEIEKDPARLGLAGREIAWFRDKFEAFLVQVQGAARLELLEGGDPVYLGYAGNNGREYTSVGKLLAAENRMERDKINTQSIHEFFRQNPKELDGYLNRNDRYIFFKETSPVNWPAGCLGVEVTPLRSLATDKTLFPRGGVVFVKTKLAAAGGGAEPFERFMLDQDAGGAIRAPGRADIYVGLGDAAGEIAGRQAYSGKLYYFLLKPDRLATWTAKLQRTPAVQTNPQAAPGPAPEGEAEPAAEAKVETAPARDPALQVPLAAEAKDQASPPPEGG